MMKPMRKTACTFRPCVEQLETRLAPVVSFNRVVIDPSSPTDPWVKAQADLNGDGFQDLIVAGNNSDLVWYAYAPVGTTWSKHTIASGVTSESGSAVGSIVGDGIPDIVVGNEWFENPRHSGGDPNGLWARHALPAFGTHD